MWRRSGGAALLALTVCLVVQPAAIAAGPTYSSSWGHGLEGWAKSSGGWAASRGVVSYSGAGASVLVAPARVKSGKYVVQAAVRLMAWRETGISESHGMGILIRATGPVDPTAETAGVMAGLGKGFVGCDGVHSNAVMATADTDFTALAQDKRAFSAGHAWHTVRVEVRGNTIKLIIDGRLRTSTSTRRFATGTSVGLFSLSARMQAKDFTIERL